MNWCDISRRDSVSVENTTNSDPGEGGKIPLPEDHAKHCTGATCWCKHY